jgi:uncharacterized protein with gpF-like domain
MKLNTNGKPKTLPAVHYNRSTEANYRRRMNFLIDEMHSSLLYWLRIAYAANEPAIVRIAQDLSPAKRLQKIMGRLARRWQKRFDEAAPKLAQYLAKATKDRSDSTMKTHLKDAGFTVKFQPTKAMIDAYDSVAAENVGLIKSIAQQHLAAVQGEVQRAVQTGWDLGPLSKSLEESFGVTKRRAAFIARDQASKANAVMVRVRQTELGIKWAEWAHSGGGRHPRPDHVAAGKQRLCYDVSKGALISGEYIFPGQLPGCRCVARPIIPGLEDG